MEAILAATAQGEEMMGEPEKLGKVQPGYLADLILLEGDPAQRYRHLQDQSRPMVIMKDDAFHKEPPKLAA
jgi:imidazolonepropionase-like amidohydrolase